MYRLIMAIRSDALPTDPAALTGIVLALDAENEKLRVAMQTFKDMIFGKRSEWLATLVAEYNSRLSLTILRPASRHLQLPTTMQLRQSRSVSHHARRHAATSVRCPSTCHVVSR
ncbi:hypothetical protein ACVIHH_008400 [Bradyrhizobium sp. USDA 4518]